MISKVNIQDLKSLFELENRVFNNDPFALSKESFKYHILKNEIYKIEIDGKIAGYILWLNRKHYYRLYSLVVDSSFQGKGIASKLLEYSFEKLKDKNMQLEVKQSNEKAIKLYEKFGFIKKKILKEYYEDCDGILMFYNINQ